MTFLLFVTAVFVAASSGLKLRSTSRVGLGLRPLALLELAAALGLAALVVPGPLSGTSVARWAVPAAILLLVVSSVDHAVRLRAYRRARAQSEGGRLAAYVKYLSVQAEGDEGGDTGSPPQARDNDVDTTHKDDPTA